MRIEFATQTGLRTVDARPVGFSVVSENWNEYRLEDGRTLRTKMVVTQVIVPKDKEILGPNGEDVVSVRHQFVVVVEEASAD